MARYREVCKVTLRPRRWVSDPSVVTQQCGFGACEDCTRTYAGKGNTNDLYRHDREMWANQYSICNTAREGELLDYGKYETYRCQVGDVVVFEYNTNIGTFPRKGRIVKIEGDRCRIMSPKYAKGGYEAVRELPFGLPKREMWRYFWRDLEDVMWVGGKDCPIHMDEVSPGVYQ